MRDLILQRRRRRPTLRSVTARWALVCAPGLSWLSSAHAGGGWPVNRRGYFDRGET